MNEISVAFFIVVMSCSEEVPGGSLQYKTIALDNGYINQYPAHMVQYASCVSEP